MNLSNPTVIIIAFLIESHSFLCGRRFVRGSILLFSTVRVMTMNALVHMLVLAMMTMVRFVLNFD